MGHFYIKGCTNSSKLLPQQVGIYFGHWAKQWWHAEVDWSWDQGQAVMQQTWLVISIEGSMIGGWWHARVWLGDQRLQGQGLGNFHRWVIGDWQLVTKSESGIRVCKGGQGQGLGDQIVMQRDPATCLVILFQKSARWFSKMGWWLVIGDRWLVTGRVF